MGNEDESKLERFFREIGRAVLGIGKIPRQLKKINLDFSGEKSEGEIPSFLEGFLKNRNAGWPEYVILKVQICVLLLFASAVIFSVSFQWSIDILSGLAVLSLSIYSVYLLFTQIKQAFKRDFPAYRSFIFIILFIVLEVVAIGRLGVLNYFEGIYYMIFPVILVFASGITLFIAFRHKYGREYTYATVKETKGSKAEVETNYDIRSNVKNGVFHVESMPDIEPGDRVRVEVDRPVLGLRGSEPTLILEKIE